MAQQYGEGGGIEVYMEGPFGSGGSVVKLTNITLLKSAWKGAESPYSQEVTCDAVSVNSTVNLSPSVDEIGRFQNQYIAFTAKNYKGTVTLYAIGDKPAADCVFQVNISDGVNTGLSDGAAIWGNTVCTPMVRTNWEQEDPTKADYLKGRGALEMLIQNTCENAKNEAINVANDAKTAAANAQTAAGKAQTAANSAQTAADKAQSTANSAQTAASNAQTTADSKCSKLTKTVTLSGWSSNKTKTVTVSGVLSDTTKCDVIVSPLEASREVYNNCVVRCTAQGTNTLTFMCDEVPSTSLSVGVIILK